MALLKIKDTDGTWQAQGNVGVFGSSGGGDVVEEITTVTLNNDEHFSHILLSSENKKYKKIFGYVSGANANIVLCFGNHAVYGDFEDSFSWASNKIANSICESLSIFAGVNVIPSESGKYFSCKVLKGNISMNKNSTSTSETPIGYESSSKYAILLPLGIDQISIYSSTSDAIPNGTKIELYGVKA